MQKLVLNNAVRFDIIGPGLDFLLSVIFLKVQVEYISEVQMQNYQYINVANKNSSRHDCIKHSPWSLDVSIPDKKKLLINNSQQDTP